MDDETPAHAVQSFPLRTRPLIKAQGRDQEGTGSHGDVLDSLKRMQNCCVSACGLLGKEHHLISDGWSERSSVNVCEDHSGIQWYFGVVAGITCRECFSFLTCVFLWEQNCLLHCEPHWGNRGGLG